MLLKLWEICALHHPHLPTPPLLAKGPCLSATWSCIIRTHLFIRSLGVSALLELGVWDCSAQSAWPGRYWPNSLPFLLCWSKPSLGQSLFFFNRQRLVRITTITHLLVFTANKTQGLLILILISRWFHYFVCNWIQILVKNHDKVCIMAAWWNTWVWRKLGHSWSMRFAVYNLV